MSLKEMLGDAYHDGMTNDEVFAALDTLDLVPRAEATKGMVRKELFDKTASDLAARKKEKAAAEQDLATEKEAVKSLTEQVNALLRDNQINKHCARFVKMGYSEKLAQETAEALVNQDYDTVFANQSAFLAEHDKAMQKNITLSGDHRPPAGSGQPAMDFVKMAQQAGEQGNFAAQAYYTRMAQQMNHDE